MVELSFFANSSGVSVAEIAALTGGNPCAGADLSRVITGIAPIDSAGANDLTFVRDAQFAKALAISVHTLRNWEQGRRTPEGPALALLRVAARHPRVLRENLAVPA